jgi:hypothetical protein
MSPSKDGLIIDDRLVPKAPETDREFAVDAIANTVTAAADLEAPRAIVNE